MNFTLLVASFCLLNLIYGVKCDTDNYENIREAGSAVKIITKAIGLLGESDYTEFFTGAKTLAKQFANLSQDFNEMVTSGIELIKSLERTTTEIETARLKITTQFTVVYGKLQLLEKQINQVNILFKDKALKSQLINFYDMRERIRDILDSFSKNPNKISVDQLKEICSGNPTQAIIAFLKSQITNGGEGSLLEAMKRGNNRKTFFQWTKNIYGMFIEAVALDNICYTAIYFNVLSQEEKSSTLNTETRKYEETLNMITNKLESEHNEFLKLENYMKWVEDDLREQMRINAEMSHELFSTYMKLFLVDKYDWRSWIVGSYDGDTVTFDQHGHTNSNYSIKVFRQDNRCAFVYSMKNYENDANKKKEMEKLGQIRDYVLRQGPHKFFHKEKCQNILQLVRAKYAGANIACVDSRKHMELDASPGAVYTSFSVTTLKANGKTRTFPSKAECDKWVHRYRGGFPAGFSLGSDECYGKSMNVTITYLLD